MLRALSETSDAFLQENFFSVCRVLSFGTVRLWSPATAGPAKPPFLSFVRPAVHKHATTVVYSGIPPLPADFGLVKQGKQGCGVKKTIWCSLPEKKVMGVSDPCEGRGWLWDRMSPTIL